MTWYVHINRHVIDRNTKRGESEPPVCIRRGKSGKAVYASRVLLPEGSELVYSPHVPLLSCGARMVVVCPTEPKIIV